MKTWYGPEVVLSFREVEEPYEMPVLDCPQKAAMLSHDIRNKDREHMVAYHLNAKNGVICRETVSVGTLSATLICPREVFKSAILANAAAIILVHNHPSGVVTSSPDDKELTRRLIEVGEIVGIPVLDHVIVTPTGDWCSIVDAI